MNRKKKINQTLKAKAKKANAKKAGIPANKPKYIAKSEREAMLQQDASIPTMDDAQACLTPQVTSETVSV
jgi:hypothetical protein